MSRCAPLTPLEQRRNEILHRLRLARVRRIARRSLPALSVLLVVLLVGTPLAQQTHERPRGNGTVQSDSTRGSRQEEVPAAESNATNTAEGESNGARNAAEADPQDNGSEIDGEGAGEDAETAEEPSDADSSDRLDLAPRRPLFDRDELLQSMPPAFSDDSEGFIPDIDSSDLFERRPGTTPRERYSSLLGYSQLPPGQVRDAIGIQSADPGRALDDNFARVIVPDGNIEGSTRTKQFKIRGGVIIFYNDVVITAEEADIDEKNEMAILRESVEIVDPMYTVKTNEILIFFGEKRFQAKGFVQFRRNARAGGAQPDLSLPNRDRLSKYFSGQQFELFSNRLDYNWDTKELAALEAVRLAHPDFNGTMERLEYNDRDKVYAMYGDVELDVAKYDWIFRNQLVAAEDEPKVRAITDTPTQITAAKVLYSDETALAQFYALNGGQVKFDQRGKRSITASFIEVNDQTKDFFAEGVDDQPATFNQTDGQWLLSAELISADNLSDELSETLERPLTASAKTITYNFERKRLEMKTGVSIQGQTQSLTAGEMVQDETAKFFLVRENVRIKPDNGNEITAAQVYVDTSTDTFTFVGLVQGSMVDEQMAAQAVGAGVGQSASGEGGGTGQGRRGLFESNPRQ